MCLFPLVKKMTLNRIHIQLKNHPGILWIAKHNLCVVGEREKEIAKQYGEISYSGKCSIIPGRVNLCRIHTTLDGWDVSLSAAGKLYKNPELACKIVKTFLKKYTVKRDGLLQKTKVGK